MSTANREKSANHNLILIPQPVKIEYLQGTYQVPPGLAEELLSYPEKPVHQVEFKTDRSIPHPQAYRLQIDRDGITAVASSPAGHFYAMMTLRQIQRQIEEWIPYVRIEDQPDFPVRGVMLDISRNRVPTMETILQLVDLWSELKLNQVQLYTEHTFAYKNHQAVWEQASPFTGREIEELDAYCRKRCIDLVPNQNSFGHLERWLVHPEYRHLAESPGGFTDFWGNKRDCPTTLFPGFEEAIEFLQGLYDELLPHFSSKLFNVGCDETFELGQGRSKLVCKERGTGPVYLDFLLKIYQEVKKRGKRMQFWADMVLRYPELIPQLPDDLIAMIWGYEADHPFKSECSAFADTGLEFYVCSGTSAWNSLGGRWENARGNLLSAAQAGLAGGASGYLITEWGDYGHWQQHPIPLPGYLYGAALSWCQKQNREIDLERCLSVHVFEDKSGQAAQGLMLLGRAYLDSGVSIHNATLFHALFFDDLIRDCSKSLQKLAKEDLSRAEANIRRALELVDASETSTADGDLLQEELRFSCRQMLHACALGQAPIAAESMEIAGIPKQARDALASELEEIKESFVQLWLKRSRPGGLKESLRGFDKLLAKYRSD